MEIPTTPIPLKSTQFSILKILQFTVLVSIVLYFGKTLFIPLSFAMLMSFILYPVCKWMEKKGINRRIAIVLSILGITVLLGGVFYLLFSQLIEFTYEWHIFKVKIVEAHNQLSIFIAERFGVSSESQLVYIKKFIGSLQIIPLLQSTAYSLSESLFFLMMILIYSSLILFYRQLLTNVVYRIFHPDKRETIHEILVETIHAFYNFMKGMMLVYLIVGILNSTGLAIIGVPHPILFGFIASILTFIPYVGIMIASLLPITIAWIEFNSIWYPIGVILVFAIVQLLEAYIIFPLAVGGRLRINTLVILVMIVAGGILWGAAGMILFIPFISIVKLIADRTESLKTLSLLLGEGK
jgi:predicted PurR-regulated permease PerM